MFNSTEEMFAWYRKNYGSCLYACVCGKASLKIIEKLLTLTDIDSFWDNVRKMTKNIHSSYYDGMWQRYAELRYEELQIINQGE